MYYNEKTIIFKDGAFVHPEQTKIDAYSQTLHYGYGVFEGIRSYETAQGAQIFKAKEHYNRLKRSCELLSIPFNWEVDYLIEKTYELLELNHLSDAYIRPIVVLNPNMSLTAPDNSSLLIMVWEWGSYLGDKLLNVFASSYLRPHPKSTHIEAKANGHYVNSILATSEAKSKGYDEALLNDVDGFLAEAPGANLFIEKSGKIHTPALGNILPGITRSVVIELCNKLGIEVIQDRFKPEFLQEADAAFFCGTAAEVIGIKYYNDIELPLSFDNSLGKKLQTEYKKLVLNQISL